MDGNNEGADADARRREEHRVNLSGDSEANNDECEIREYSRRVSPAMLSEGAEGSLRSRQSRKHLQHDHDYDREAPRERVSRSRPRPPRTPRRRRSRSISVRDYRVAGPSKHVPRDRSRSRDEDALLRRRLRRSRSSSYERFKEYSRYLQRRASPKRYGRSERKRRYTYSSSDDDQLLTPKRKRLYSRSPSVERTKSSSKLSHKDRTDKALIDKLPGTNEDVINKFLDVIKSIKGNSTSKLSLNNVLPEFDPLLKDQTILAWLTKVEECAEIYGWTEKEIIHFALPKLAGAAKSWYRGLDTVLYSWSQWKRKLIENFPSRDDYAELLLNMLAKKSKYGDSLEQYYYDKIILLNRCSIKGRRAVDCLLNGIEDRAVRVGAQAARFREPEEVLKYLKTVKVGVGREVGDRSGKQIQDKRSLGNSAPTRFEPPQKLVCHNCNEDGHKSFQCKKTLNNCTTCGKLGHLPAFCRFSRNNSNNKDQKGLTTTEEKQVLS